MKISNRFSILATVCCMCAATSIFGVESKPDAGQVEADKKALAPIFQYVGGWRGAGLPKEGPAKDGWTEESEWQFDLKGGHAALVFNSDKGKYYKSGRIDPGEKKGTFKFTGISADGKIKEELVGEIDKNGDLAFDNAAAAEGRPSRMLYSVVAKGNRLLIDLQKKSPGGRYSTFCEVSYTRKGSGFGQQANAHECIITGGAGKMEVSYKGQTYWVCCGGCRDAFNENPEKEIAAYKKRKEEEKLKDKN